MRALRAAFALLPALELKTSSRCAMVLSSAGYHSSTSLYSSSSSSSSSSLDPSTSTTSAISEDALEQQRQILLQRGKLEAELMSNNPTSPLVYQDPCTDDNNRLEFATSYANTVIHKGVLGLASMIPCSNDRTRDDGSTGSSMNCQELRDYILDYRARSREDIRNEQISRHERFAKCLLSDHRDDLLLPLTTLTSDPTSHDSIVRRALRQVLKEGNVGAILEELVGPDATLFELAALISDPGSDRQNVHPDHGCDVADDDNGARQHEKPLVATCFVALQDIDHDMGPTIWLPGTHTPKMHAQFQRRRVEDVFASESPKDALLRSMPVVVGAPMPAGACALFDSRVLHAGTANTSSQSTRVIFYFSFKRRDANVGVEKGSLGYGLDGEGLTVSDLLII